LIAGFAVSIVVRFKVLIRVERILVTSNFISFYKRQIDKCKISLPGFEPFYP